jgi:hypothetical protein
MRHQSLSSLLSVGAAAMVLAGCEAPGRVAEPTRLAASNALMDVHPAHPIELLDQCDPASFNLAIGPGTCMSPHPGIDFNKFIADVIASHSAPAWRNAPQNFAASLGTQLVAINKGGEMHTFTHVAKFGGSVVPQLNALLGNVPPAPECAAAGPEEYLLPGGIDAETVNTPGTALYQCCIHPWMQTVITVR